MSRTPFGTSVVKLLILGTVCGAESLVARSDEREAASRDAIVRDWMLQDYMNIPLPAKLEQEKERWRQEHVKARESKPDAPVLESMACFVSDRDSIVERRMIARVLYELGETGREMREQADALADTGVPGADTRWRYLY